MLSKEDCRELINDIFEEEALVLGGLIAMHDVDDEMIWSLLRSFGVIRRKALKKLTTDNIVLRDEPLPKPHPAIEEFLTKLR